MLSVSKAYLLRYHAVIANIEETVFWTRFPQRMRAVLSNLTGYVLTALSHKFSRV